MIGVVLLVLLALHFGAHVALVYKLGRTISPLRAGIAFFVSPLAPYWGFKNALSRHAWAWLGTLALYAAAVSVVRGCV